jgi:6-phosphofructokinase 1
MAKKESQTRCIGVLTSGGDAPGMNSAVRAVVRTALQKKGMKVKVFVIKEGYEGLVKGGKDFIVEVNWDYVSGIIHKGGTKIGTTRCEEFKQESGKLKAARNLIKNGIDRLIVIGGDGSITGANELHKEWPNLLEKLAAGTDEDKEISKKAANKPPLAVVGLVGSIDNDMSGTDMTIGADTALHRISEAVDAINSTAASHHRIFVVEVMGRKCGYLALMGALISGADWVLIPEKPTVNEDWKERMIYELKKGMEGKRAIIVILAEGAIDYKGKEISSSDLAKALEQGLKKEGEVKPPDVRVTILGHVQRGGSPSAYDRILSSRLGHAAVEKILKEEAFAKPSILGVKGTDIEVLSLTDTVEKNKRISEAIAECKYDDAMMGRGIFFQKAYEVARILMKPEELVDTLPLPESAPRFAVLHSGAPAPGMNAAVRAAVRLAINKGYGVLGIERGFEGLIRGNIKSLGWSNVNGWASMGGAELGISRKIPGDMDFIRINENMEEHHINGLLIIGGWTGYQGASELLHNRNKFPSFNIPIICMPATINNNLPGTDICIGSDTALNNIVDVVDKIKQSAVAARRCFVVEVMGRYCGYLALMSGLAAGAEQVYMHEEKVNLENLQEDLGRLKNEFDKDKRRLALMIRNEKAYGSYDTRFMTALFNEEGSRIEKKFDARQAILGHLQQGGNPSPFDRILAARMADDCINFLANQVENGTSEYAFIGINKGQITEPINLANFRGMVEEEYQRVRNPWWLKLRSIATLLAREPS